MRTIIMASAFLATGLAVPALADGSDSRCTRSPDGRDRRRKRGEQGA